MGFRSRKARRSSPESQLRGQPTGSFGQRLAGIDQPVWSAPCSKPPNELADEAVIPERRNAQFVVDFEGRLQRERRIEPVIKAECVSIAVERNSRIGQAESAKVEPGLRDIYPVELHVVETEDTFQFLKDRIRVV